MKRWLFACLLMYVELAFAQAGASLEVRVTGRSNTDATAVEVVLFPVNRTEQITIPGTVVFDHLPSGIYRITLSADSLIPVDSTVVLRAGEPLTVTVFMQPVTATLDVVTIETKADDPAAMVFTREQIAASAARDLPDFLNREAGVELRSDGAAGAPVTARIGGSGSNQVLVLVDGRRIQNSANGEADLSAIPLEWIETVRVHRGGDNLSGREAIGGVLEIVTRTPGSQSEIAAGAEVYPTYHRWLFQRSGKTGSLKSLLSYTRTQGPGDFAYVISEDDGTGPHTINLGQQFRRLNAGILRDQAFVKLDVPVVPAYPLEISGSLDRAARGMPGYLAPQLTPQARQTTQSGALNLKLSHAMGATASHFRASYQLDQRNYENPDPIAASHSWESSRQWEAELAGSTLFRRAKLSGGGSATLESLTSDQLVGGYAERRRWALWTNARLPLWKETSGTSAFTLEPGLRAEGFGRNRAALPGIRAELTRTLPFNMGAVVAWGQSYRAPDFYSLFWLDDLAARGNAELKPERSSEWTARVFLETIGEAKTRMDLAISDQRIEDLIFWKRTFENFWKPFNLKQAHVQTLDIAVEQSLWLERIRFVAGWNWTEARDATTDRNTGGKYLTFRAPNSQRATAILRLHPFEAAATCRRVAARPVLESNSKWLRAYTLVDLSLSYDIRLGRIHMESSIGVDNLLAENYRIIRHAPMPGRELFATLRISQP